MANLLIFEDDAEIIYEHIKPAIQETAHEIVGCADSLLRAQEYISKMLSHEIEVDVILLDGTLDPNKRPTEFRHTFPLDGTEPTKKGLFGRVKAPQPREVVLAHEYGLGRGRDARIIKKILEVCEIEVPIIGISGDSMEEIGVEVDIDLGKWGLRNQGLLTAIESLTDR
jgi:hypothetical protein